MSRDNKLLAFALMWWGFGEGLFLYIEPLYLRELGADPVGIGAALSLAAVALGATHIPAGFLADHFGRKPLFLAGWGLGVLATLLMFLAPNLPLFVLALMLYSFTGFVISPIYGYAAEARGQQSVQRAITLVSAGFWAGTIFSPALGGWIGQTFGLRYVFGVACAAFVVSTLTVLLLRAQPKTPAPPGQARYAALLRNRRFTGFLALMLAGLLAIQIGMPFMPNFAEDVRRMDVGVIGVLGSVSSVGIVMANVVLGQRMPRRGFLIAQGLMALSMLLLLGVASWPGLAAAYFLRAGWFLAHNMGAAQVGRIVAPSESGLAFGLFETVTALALILGPLAAGPLYERSAMLPFQVSLGLIALTMPLIGWLAPREAEAEPLPVSGESVPSGDQ